MKYYFLLGIVVRLSQTKTMFIKVSLFHISRHNTIFLECRGKISKLDFCKQQSKAVWSYFMKEIKLGMPSHHIEVKLFKHWNIYLFYCLIKWNPWLLVLLPHTNVTSASAAKRGMTSTSCFKKHKCLLLILQVLLKTSHMKSGGI